MSLIYTDVSGYSRPEGRATVAEELKQIGIKFPVEMLAELDALIEAWNKHTRGVLSRTAFILQAVEQELPRLRREVGGLEAARKRHERKSRDRPKPKA